LDKTKQKGAPLVDKAREIILAGAFRVQQELLEPGVQSWFKKNKGEKNLYIPDVKVFVVHHSFQVQTHALFIREAFSA
jgi:hypothetical protein